MIRLAFRALAWLSRRLPQFGRRRREKDPMVQAFEASFIDLNRPCNYRDRVHGAGDDPR